jgi:hypothetical protein
MKCRSLIAILLPVLLMSCGGDFYMLKQDQKPELKADSEKATLVIYRNISAGFAVTIDNFLDNKFIGQTKGKCYFITRLIREPIT